MFYCRTDNQMADHLYEHVHDYVEKIHYKILSCKKYNNTVPQYVYVHGFSKRTDCKMVSYSIGNKRGPLCVTDCGH